MRCVHCGAGRRQRTLAAGLQKFIFGALFPMNLLLILTTGGQLFTGNVAAVPAALCATPSPHAMPCQCPAI